jgi:hypothetical protein
MRMTRGWTGLRSALFALAIGLASASGAKASPALINYSTSGGVDSSGVTGANVISFNSVDQGAFVTPSAFSLGEFLTAALPAGVSTSYTNTPFHVTYGINQINGTNTSIEPITITGLLNGTITGPSQSSVVATFNPITTPDFTISSTNNELSVLSTTVSLVPSTTNGGRTTAQAQLLTQIAPVPEPATIAVFLTAMAGVGLRRRLRPRA